LRWGRHLEELGPQSCSSFTQFSTPCRVAVQPRVEDATSVPLHSPTLERLNFDPSIKLGRPTALQIDSTRLDLKGFFFQSLRTTTNDFPRNSERVTHDPLFAGWHFLDESSVQHSLPISSSWSRMRVLSNPDTRFFVIQLGCSQITFNCSNLRAAQKFEALLYLFRSMIPLYL
jgi:hypothetical protein